MGNLLQTAIGLESSVSHVATDKRNKAGSHVPTVRDTLGQPATQPAIVRAFLSLPSGQGA